MADTNINGEVRNEPGDGQGRGIEQDSEEKLADSPSVGCEPEAGSEHSVTPAAIGKGTTGECGSGRDKGTGALENTNGSGDTQPADQQSDIPSEPSRGDSEEGRSMGDSTGGRARGFSEDGKQNGEQPCGGRFDNTGCQDLGDSECRGLQGGDEHRQTTEVVGARCSQPVGGNENGEVGDSGSDGQFRSEELDQHQTTEQQTPCGSDIGRPDASSEEWQGGEGQPETEPPVGGNPDGTTFGMVLSEYTGLNNQELEEIFDWMRLGTSRVEELRLLGNGVVPQAAEKGFRTLYERLMQNEKNSH